MKNKTLNNTKLTEADILNATRQETNKQGFWKPGLSKKLQNINDATLGKNVRVGNIA